MGPTAALQGGDLAATVRGALEVELADGGVRPWRLPAVALRQAPASLALMSEFTAGVRLRLQTAATRLELDASILRLVGPGQAAPATAAPFVAVVDGEPVDRVDVTDTGLVHETRERTYRREPGEPTTIRLRLGGEREAQRLVELWLPQDAAVVLHELRADAALAPAPAPDVPRWVHHGSSISHGGSADGPLGTWPRLAAAALGLDGINLGFGGNAMLDPLVARAIAATPAELITLELGINVVGADAMRRRVLGPAVHGFLDLIRDRQPEVPIVVVTAFGCPAVESTPGPIHAGPDGRAAGTPRERTPGDGILTLADTRDVLAEVVASRSDDPRLHLLDGLALFGVDDAPLLPDGLHPGQAGLTLIAERFVAALRRLAVVG